MVYNEDLKNVIGVMADVSSLLVSLAQKNMELTNVFSKAVVEGRLPTKEEHEQVRKGFDDQLALLKETYTKMTSGV